MKKRSRVAQIAISKLRKFLNTEFVACLTPAEAVYLIDKGCKLTETNLYKEDMLRASLKAGHSYATWCYFRSITVDLPKIKPFNVN